MYYYTNMDIYEAENEYDRWVEDEAYNTDIIPEYIAELESESELM